MPKPRTVLIDESGDWGIKPDSSKTMTMTAVITDNPQALAEIPPNYEKNTRINPEKRGKYPNELKYSTSNDEVRQGVIKEVMSTDPKIKAVVVDKSTAPKRGSKAYQKTAEALLDDVMKDPVVQGGVEVVFDKNKDLSQNAAVLAVDSAAKIHGVKINASTTTKSSIETPELQATDFPTGAIGAKYNMNDVGRGNPNDYKRIRSKTTVRHVKLKKN